MQGSRTIIPLFLPMLICLFPGDGFRKPPSLPLKIDGVSLVAPPVPFPKDPFSPIRELGADWIAVVPYGFTRPGADRVFYDSHWQWWGERPEGARETIRQARAAGLRVMLKPQLYIPGSWTGDIDYSRETGWQQWEGDYEEFILTFAFMAAEEEVELFCIGTEFKKSTEKRSEFWKNLIKKIRTVYTGKLTYAANWDEFHQISFWDELDYIGIDAYFPLHDAPTPGVESLKRSWKPWKTKIEKTRQKFEKPVLFTEFGYLSVDGCAYNTWELEKRIHQLNVNEKAQANALEALFQSFAGEPYWHGGFLWKWFPNMQGHEGYPEKDYSPQGKTGSLVLKTWYSRENR